MKNAIWDAERVREEIKRLDEITGLDGAKCPISFGNARRRLGCYCYADGGSFRFSNYYFQDNDWPVECAIDVIRHEYAHYMNHQVNNASGHGVLWKECCKIVGAVPSRLYKEEREEFWRNKHSIEKKIMQCNSVYVHGTVIKHPKFGRGIVEGVASGEGGKYIKVSFDKVGEKKLDILWVEKNCVKEKPLEPMT